MEKILEKIQEEMRRQDKKWGEQNHPPIKWIAILVEEVGEASKESVDHHFEYQVKSLEEKELSLVAKNLQTQRLLNYRRELVQVAAVAIQMIRSLERNELKNT